jgi:hypothetical protein
LMDGRLLDVLSDFALVAVIFTKSSIPISNLLIEVKLIVIGIAGHKLRLAQRKLVALIRLPQMEDLAVQCDNLFHLFVLCDFPDSLGDTGRAGHEQHAGLYFEDVRMPVFALVLLEGFVEAGTDHVFNTDETGIGFGRVVEKALSHLWEGLVGC